MGHHPQEPEAVEEAAPVAPSPLAACAPAASAAQVVCRDSV